MQKQFACLQDFVKFAPKKALELAFVCKMTALSKQNQYLIMSAIRLYLSRANRAYPDLSNDKLHKETISLQHAFFFRCIMKLQCQEMGQARTFISTCTLRDICNWRG